MTGCDVSVIIPTYNRLEFLREALDSVWNQGMAPREVIVVDDGSEDGTLDWLRSLDREGLQVIAQARGGPAAARNRGMALARGRYLAFLDSDDLWLPEKLRVQLEFMAAHPECRFCQTEEQWIRRGVRVNPMKKHAKPSGWVFAECLRLCLISPSAVLLEREFLEALGGFDESFPVCEDYELWLRASLRSPCYTIQEPMVVKRGGHADQLSRAHWGMDRFRVLAIEKILKTEALTAEQRGQARRELAAKLKILSKGFAKRNPTAQDPYEEKLRCLETDSH